MTRFMIYKNIANKAEIPCITISLLYAVKNSPMVI